MAKKFYILGVIMCLSLNLSAGKIKKGFEALDIYNYFAAKKLFEKALKRDQVAASYGLSIIYLRDDNPFYNLDSARNFIVRATDNYSSLKASKKIKYAELKIDSLNLFEHRALVGTACFKRAKETHTVKGYQAFLNNTPWSAHVDSAVYYRDYLAFNQAKEIENSDAYQTFLNNYPQSYFAEEATSAFDRLIYQERTSGNNLTDYVSFLVDYPNSPYKSDAEDQIYKIYTKTGSLESYKSFIEKYPNNRNVTAAWKKMFDTHLEEDYSAASIEAFITEFEDYPFKEELNTQLELAGRELFPIKERNFWGYADLSGEVYIKPQFDDAEFFHEGLAIISLEEKYGFIDKTGEVVIPAIFDDAYEISEGHAVVEIDGKWGMINRSGEFVIQPKYEDVGNLNEGLAYFSSEDLYGFFDNKGIVRLKEQFESATDFENGKAIVSKMGHYGIIDPFGTTTVPFKYERLKLYDENSYLVRFNGKWGLIEESGDTILGFDYDYIGEMRDNRAIVEKEGTFNYFGKNGNLMLSEWIPIYAESRQLAEFSNGYAKIQFEQGYNLIDTTGKKLFIRNREDLSGYGTYIAVKKSDKWGYLSKAGSQVIGYNFTAAEAFNSYGYALAGGAPLVGVINKQGNYVIEPYYEKITFLNDTILIARSRGSYGLLTIEGDTLLNFAYISVEPFNDNLVQLQNKEALFYYNLKNNRFLRKEEE